jgi:hypothetical protein
MGWGCGLQAQDSEFKPQYIQKNKANQKKAFLSSAQEVSDILNRNSAFFMEL